MLAAGGEREVLLQVQNPTCERPAIVAFGVSDEVSDAVNIGKSNFPIRVGQAQCL